MEKVPKAAVAVGSFLSALSKILALVLAHPGVVAVVGVVGAILVVAGMSVLLWRKIVKILTESQCRRGSPLKGER